MYYDQHWIENELDVLWTRSNEDKETNGITIMTFYHRYLTMLPQSTFLGYVRTSQYLNLAYSMSFNNSIARGNKPENLHSFALKYSSLRNCREGGITKFSIFYPHRFTNISGHLKPLLFNVIMPEIQFNKQHEHYVINID